MQNQSRTITPEQIIALAETLPPEKLESWYEYGLFIKARHSQFESGEENLQTEIAAWEAASDEDLLNFECELSESK
ncbi:MAG TPA: hypothetical protein VF648_06600 [Pyrinomonadaceae bacterium]|jgi:hypothetical protein